MTMQRNELYAKNILTLIFLSAAFLVSAPAHAGGPDGGPLPHEIPDLDKTPTLLSVQSGPWNNPATWDMGRVPNDQDIVHVHHSVTVASIDCTALVIGIQMGGALRFDPAVNTRLSVGTLLVRHEGTLEIGTENQPIFQTVTAEIMIRDIPLDTGTVADPGTDPEQYGTGIIGLGKVTMHGTVKTSGANSRLAVEPRIGDTTLTLEEPVTGWQPGDRLILPDTRQLDWNERGNSGGPYVPQWEELQIASMSPDGKIITLTSWRST